MPSDLDYKVDMRPLDKPVNPFAFAARQVRARHPQLAGDDLEAVEWLEYLASRSPDLKTEHSVVVLVLAESATFASTRQLLREGLDLIESELAAASAA